jgi:hypothetical protein
MRELVVLLLLSGFGCGLAMAQGDLMFVAIFGAACAMPSVRRNRAAEHHRPGYLPLRDQII